MSEPLEEATRLIHAIGAAILADPGKDAMPDWVALSLVSTVHEGGASRMNGYYYAANGAWTPGVPTTRELFALMRALWERTPAPDGRRWKMALVQVDRQAGKLHAEYEWDDATRWKVTPFNFRVMPETLKPACVTWPLAELDAPSIKGGWGEPGKLN